ncbi:MAG: DNA mismatch repair endonuclease MutH [Byssovorax sp.]
MKLTPLTLPSPRSEDELLGRARELTGRRMSEIAAALRVSIAGDGVSTKGTMGALIERALGATGGSAAVPDFPHLGVELKTIPVDAEGRPRESTFVCTLSLADADRAEWSASWVRRKLARVLWIPILVPRGSALGARTVGVPLLWRPTPAEDAMLRDDFDEIMGLIGVGAVDRLTARTGRVLQARPKAAHGRVRTAAFGPEDEPTTALPRGFYLRAGFTGAVLRDAAAIPDPFELKR